MQPRDVDASVLKTILEIDPIGFAKQIGIEKHTPVGAMGDGAACGAGSSPGQALHGTHGPE